MVIFIGAAIKVSAVQLLGAKKLAAKKSTSFIWDT
jgi:hypothetical protein